MHIVTVLNGRGAFALPVLRQERKTMPARKDKAGLMEMLSAFLDDVDSKAPSTHGYIAATREDLCSELVAFGEDAVAAKVATISRAKLAEIFRRAGELDTRAGSSSRGKSLCVAAVEVVEGTARPLARQRRRSIR
jgi:hypothetical protein